MYEKKTLPTLNCGLDLVGEVLYGKWKIRILWFIHQGNLRPSELQRKIPDVTRRVLNVQLKELEDHEMVTKKIYPIVPPKVEYRLTDFGKSIFLSSSAPSVPSNAAPEIDLTHLTLKIDSLFALATPLC